MMVIVITSCFIFVSCQKNSAPSPLSTVSTCTDSAHLVADSLFTCYHKSVFFIPSKNKTIVANNAIVAIDTIVNSAGFTISYDSIGMTACGGTNLISANITCYHRY